MKNPREAHGKDFGLFFDTETVLLDEQTPFQHLLIVKTESMGNVMFLDGLVMVTDRDEMYYHESITHPVACRVPELKNALIIGGGDGGTARELLRYPGLQVTQVEIDNAVVEGSKKYHPTMAVSYSNPRMHLIVGDGCAYAAEYKGTPYDLICIDSSEPIGPNGTLFTPEFYGHIRRILSPKGHVVVQTGSPMWQKEEITEIVGKLKGVFPSVEGYTGYTPTYPGGFWAFCACGNGPLDRAVKRDVFAETHWTTAKNTEAMLGLGIIAAKDLA